MMKLISTQYETSVSLGKVSKKMSPGPRDERGVLQARILAAARAQFAQNGLAGTTIRAVARAAEVDGALVYHYFGSKQGLLDAATTPPRRWLDSVAHTWQTPPAELGAALLRLMLDAWADEEIGPVLRTVVLTAAHDESTRQKLRRIVENSLIGGAQLGCDEPERLRRSGLVAAQIIGLALTRFVWHVEPLASMGDDELVAAVAPNLQRYIDGDLG